MRVLVLARHGQSLQNVDGVVNGDPRLDRGLSPLGIHEAETLRGQLAALQIDLCVTSEFPRARRTAELALGPRSPAVRHLPDRDLNDIRIGDLEGKTLADYREVKDAHTRADPFPGGESLDQAALRYAGAFERIRDRPEDVILCVCHEIPVRYALNAASGSDAFDAPVHDVRNAVPYLLDPGALTRAVTQLRRLVSGG